MKIGDLAVHFREMAPGDLNFVRDSWIESWRTAHAAGTLPDSIYWPAYREAIRRLLARSHVIVAYNGEEENQVFGWICFERQPYDETQERLVHFLFVKSFCRRAGIARALMLSAGIDPARKFTFTHKTAATSKLGWAGVWNPTAARREPQGMNDPQD